MKVKKVSKKKIADVPENIPPKKMDISQDINCVCGHARVTHYGGKEGHCNSSGCVCLVFK